MPSYRKLPSGRWQATVRLPDGARTTASDPLKSVVREWAKAVEADAQRGVWRDHRRERVTVGEWRERWARGRMVEAETARADEISWRLHLAAHFAGRPLEDVTRTEVEAWVLARVRAGVGASAVRRALNYLKTLLEGAVDEDLVPGNVARKVAGPVTPRRLPDWYTRSEVDRITAALVAAGHESHAVMVKLMCWVGLRWGEAAALRGDDVDWLRGMVRVDHVLTQGGADKAYPKTSTSIREVPAPAWLVKELGGLLVGRERGDRIFVTTRGGRDLSAANWRKVFDEARATAGVGHGTPHTCRHTAASWLVQQGVPLYEVQRQLGHSSVQTTQVYAHLSPENHRQVVDAWGRLDAPRTHGGVKRQQKRR